MLDPVYNICMNMKYNYCIAFCISDNLDDATELDDRISFLEKKVSLQDDEIQCLKSALADALRRLSAVETQSHRYGDSMVLL